MSKKTAIWIIVVLALIIIATVVWNTYEPEYHEGVLYDLITYTFDPQTILSSLERGELSVFMPTSPQSEEDWPLLWLPASFSWNQEDYLKVADALHQFVWKEPLDDWHLVRAYFRILQCQDLSGAIDYAALSFYQRQGDLYVVHGMRIDPLRGTVTAGNDNYRYSGIWKNIDLNRIVVNSADVALRMAESNGGQEARLAVENECHIGIYFAPYVSEYNFLTRPFNRYDWGWDVFYEDKSLNFIFEITIDPYTGVNNVLDENQ